MQCWPLSDWFIRSRSWRLVFAGLSSRCLFNNSAHLSRNTFALSAPVWPAERGDGVTSSQSASHSVISLPPVLTLPPASSAPLHASVSPPKLSVLSSPLLSSLLLSSPLLLSPLPFAFPCSLISLFPPLFLLLSLNLLFYPLLSCFILSFPFLFFHLFRPPLPPPISSVLSPCSPYVLFVPPVSCPRPPLLPPRFLPSYPALTHWKNRNPIEMWYEFFYIGVWTFDKWIHDHTYW